MKSTMMYISCQDKAKNVRGECPSYLNGHIVLESRSSTEKKKTFKPSSLAKCLEQRDSENTGVKKVKPCTEYLPSRWPRNTVSVLIEKCKASIGNAGGQKYEVKEQKLIAEKEQERKLKQYKSNKVQPFTSEQDVQLEKKQQDEYDENYLDTALQDILRPESFRTTCPRNDPTSANNSGYEGNGSKSRCSICPNCNPSEPAGIISETNQPTKFSQEFADIVACDPKVGDDESDLSIDYASLDCQYTTSACTNSLQTEESGWFSSFSNKSNCINRQKNSLCTNTNNTKSVQCDSSEKLLKSRHFKSVQFKSGKNSYYSAESHSAHSENFSESVYSSRFGSVLLDREGESIRSTQLLFKSCRSNSLEDPFYTAQSELPVVFLQNQSKSMTSLFYCPKEIDAISSDVCNESQFSSQSESSHSGTLEKGPYIAELVSSPTECTEESESTLSKGQREWCCSTHLESCQPDSLKKNTNETSLFELSGEAIYVMPKILSQSDKEMESSTFRHCLSPHGQRQSEIQSMVSDQLSDESDKSHDIAFFKTTDVNILCKSKVTFEDSTFETGHETGRFNIATTELGVHEKPYLINPEVICERIQRQVNVQNRVYYWHQVMQSYFTFMTTLSNGGSLKWFFQLRPVTVQALQRLQSTLNYPFTNLNEFFNCESRDSPPSAEERMSVEWMRLQTFQNYPITASGSPIRLSREGFFYTGQGTQTRCFSCGVTHGEWDYFDNPRDVHRRLSPNCPFLNGRQEEHRNIPMSPDGSGNVGRADVDSIPPPSLPFAPLPGSGTGQSQAEGSRSVSIEVPGASRTTDEDEQQQKLESGETTPRVQSHPVEESAQSEADNRPKFPEHVSLPSRIATFSHGWPPYLDQTPQQMAEAGFFFTGNQDYTRCYQCGGGLRNWEPGDNPWIEHCRWYPTCPHVQKGKGQRFVNAVLKKQAELLSTQRAESRRKAQYGISSTDPLETLAAITLLEMGYPRDTVRNSILILRRQREPGAEITALEVLDFIWKEEDIERQRQEEEASRPRRPGDAQPPALPTLIERLNLGGSPAVTQVAVQQSVSITTTTTSLITAATTTTSVKMAISSTSGTSSTTSVSTSTSASGPTQSSNDAGQHQGQDEGQRRNTTVGENGNKRGGSMQRDGVSDSSVGGGISAKNHEGSEQGEQRPSAEGGQSEGPGAHAQAIAGAIDEDEEFHSLDSEEMEKKDYGELEEENKRLKEQTTCKICMENPISIIFLPCGHLVCCETCAPAFRKCPICRKRIQQSVKTFL